MPRNIHAVKRSPLSVRIDEQTIARLDAVAVKERRNRANLIEYLIATGLERMEREANDNPKPEHS